PGVLKQGVAVQAAISTLDVFFSKWAPGSGGRYINRGGDLFHLLNSEKNKGVQLGVGQTIVFGTRDQSFVATGYFLDSDGQVLRKDFSTPPTPKKGEPGFYASLDGSTRRSDLADRVTVPCLVFTVTDLITPSSLGWISMILPIGHLIHAVLGSCTSTMSPTLGS
ncbi:hypothetical protein Tsp_15839, partial [Trichinella spiralis]|uniref:hypothetical protein n=1 Tax=Trichinella spiralis TaxID=6334 RepID=UPI0001EFD4BD